MQQVLLTGLFGYMLNSWPSVWEPRMLRANFTNKPRALNQNTHHRLPKLNVSWLFEDNVTQTYLPAVSDPLSIHLNAARRHVRRTLCKVFGDRLASQLSPIQLMEQLVLRWEKPLSAVLHSVALGILHSKCMRDTKTGISNSFYIVG